MWTLHKAALFPSRVRVCGVLLDPPTVGHYALLEAMESPFLFGGQVGVGDLLGTVILFSVSPARAAWLVSHPIIFGLRQRALAWRMRRLRLWFKDEVKKAERWIGECIWTPDRFETEGESKPYPSAVPHGIKLLWILTEHYSEKEVLNMSIIKAQCLALARAEMNGNQYETLAEYRQQMLPEDYAYHREDYPAISGAIKALNNSKDENGNPDPVKQQAAESAYIAACEEAKKRMAS